MAKHQRNKEHRQTQLPWLSVGWWTFRVQRLSPKNWGSAERATQLHRSDVRIRDMSWQMSDPIPVSETALLRIRHVSALCQHFLYGDEKEAAWSSSTCDPSYFVATMGFETLRFLDILSMVRQLYRRLKFSAYTSICQIEGVPQINPHEYYW
jgi:hypothetical protein